MNDTEVAIAAAEAAAAVVRRWFGGALQRVDQGAGDSRPAADRGEDVLARCSRALLQLLRSGQCAAKQMPLPAGSLTMSSRAP
jgi:hypothetical protein